MTKVNEGAHLYDAAKDAIQLNYNFDNVAVQQLFNMFNDTAPKLLSLYEKREFLTYFFLGTHTIPALTPQQAWDFKISFDIRNFPANGIPAYIVLQNEIRVRNNFCRRNSFINVISTSARNKGLFLNRGKPCDRIRSLVDHGLSFPFGKYG